MKPLDTVMNNALHKERVRATLLRNLREQITGMKVCRDCQGSGNIFYMKNGKPHWETCKGCSGRGVK